MVSGVKCECMGNGERPRSSMDDQGESLASKIREFFVYAESLRFRSKQIK